MERLGKGWELSLLGWVVCTRVGCSGWIVLGRVEKGRVSKRESMVWLRTERYYTLW